MSQQNSSGIKYFFDQLNFDSGSLVCAYDFVSGGAFSISQLSLPSWYSSSLFPRRFGGRITGDRTSFYTTTSGSGNFRGSNSVEILGNIPDDEYSFLFCYEKQRTGAEVLLSSAEGTSFANSSGITLGINDSNKIFLEYWNSVEGKRSVVYDENLSSKNIILFQKSFGSFSIGLIDQKELSINKKEFPILNLNHSHSNLFKIGAIAPSCSWSKEKNFSGAFDSFYCLTGVFFDDSLSSFASGFYSMLGSSGFSGTQIVCETTQILSGSGFSIPTTGFETVIIYETGYVPTGCYLSGYSYLIGTGVTGYERVYTGIVVDKCGNNLPLYVNVPKTGLIYATGVTGVCTGVTEVVTERYENIEVTGLLTGEVFVPVNVESCVETDVFLDGSLQINYPFINSLGCEKIYVLNECEPGNIIEGFVPSGSNFLSGFTNFEAEYDQSESDFVLNSNLVGSGKNLIYNNGQLLAEGNFQKTQSGYQIIYNIISGNFSIEGSVARSNGYNQQDDFVFYDYSTGLQIEKYQLEQDLPTGFLIYSFFNNSNSGSAIFLNGIKLTPGLDYVSLNGASRATGISGSTYIKINSNYLDNFNNIYYSGSSILNGIQQNFYRFTKRNSQVYLNGIRGFPLSGYIESSRFDMLTGCPIKSIKENLIYSTDESEDFWNI
jgi:hypothetical protein